MKIYLNKAYLLVIFLSFAATCLILVLFLEPIFHSPSWIVVLTYVFCFAIMIFGFTRISPIIMKTEKNTVIFWGIPWKFIIKREWLDDVVIDAVGITFIPKIKYNFKFKNVFAYSSGTYKGYKSIKFPDHKAIGAIIEAMQPITGVDIDWNRINPKWRDYLQKKLYEAEEEFS